MYVDAQTIIEASALIGAVLAIGAVVVKIFRWFQRQEEQTEEIEKLREQAKDDIREIKDEMCLLTYAVLACLKGLQEQGCNGPVSEAIAKVEKHINQAAHDQKTA